MRRIDKKIVYHLYIIGNAFFAIKKIDFLVEILPNTSFLQEIQKTFETIVESNTQLALFPVACSRSTLAFPEPCVLHTQTNYALQPFIIRTKLLIML